MNSSTLYTAKLNKLRCALASLPTSLPSGFSVYDFCGWTPNPEKVEDCGTKCGALNADLENIFGPRVHSRVNVVERGPGIESIIDIFTHYLTGNYDEKPIIVKWVDDLVDAAEHLSSMTKRISKPSAALKRSNEWLGEVEDEKAKKKQAKIQVSKNEKERAANIDKTAQADFDDLRDREGEKLYTTGRRGYLIIDDLLIECETISTGAQRYRCSSKGCRQSWASRQPKRILGHAVQECNFIDQDTRELASQQSDELSLSKKVAGLDAAKTGKAPSKSSRPHSQPSVASLVTLEGRKAKQIRFDLAVVNFVAAAQLAPFKIDLPEFHWMIAEANSMLKPKVSSYIGSCQIPMESAHLRRKSVLHLRECRNLTISFDGGSTNRPQSFTTIHVTTPDTRIPYLMEAPEASGVSHTAEFYFKEVSKVIEEIGAHAFSGITCDSASNARGARDAIHQKYRNILVLPDPCHTLHNAIKDIVKLVYFNEAKSYMQNTWGHFARSPYANAHLSSARQQKGITRALKRPSKTRFGGWHDASESVELNLPAVETIVNNGVIDIKKDHKLSFMRNVVIYNKFKVEVHQLAEVTRPFARAIKCLESGHSNPGDVFLFTLGVMAYLRQLSDNNDTELGLPKDVMQAIENIANYRYHNMVLASGTDIYISTFFLNPQYLNTDILRRNQLNPLRRGLVILRPSNSSASPEEADLTRLFPCFPRIGLFLKGVLCRELANGSIEAAKEFSDDETGISQIIGLFKSQFATYARAFHPLKFWAAKVKHADACFLAPVAVKLFSLVPNSMAEERTMSCISKLNSKDRSRQNVSTLVHMTRIRQELIRKRITKKATIWPVLKFCDLKIVAPAQSTAASISENMLGPSVLLQGWQLEDAEPAANVQNNRKAYNEASLAQCDSDSDSDSDFECDEVTPEALSAATVESMYGVNISSRILDGLLSD
ncbi:hypothetical protein RhiJN_25102 [Ceratobasidium sp. AG-Ba]|nr:hypothetical protein RhiJN_25102 [Ceratobasidium sp. AG-Ba]